MDSRDGFQRGARPSGILKMKKILFGTGCSAPRIVAGRQHSKDISNIDVPKNDFISVFLVIKVGNSMRFSKNIINFNFNNVTANRRANYEPSLQDFR